MNDLRLHGVVGNRKAKGNAIASDVRLGRTFSNEEENDIIGTLNLSNLQSSNIKSGVNIGGVVGSSKPADMRFWTSTVDCYYGGGSNSPNYYYATVNVPTEYGEPKYCLCTFLIYMSDKWHSNYSYSRNIPFGSFSSSALGNLDGWSGKGMSYAEAFVPDCSRMGSSGAWQLKFAVHSSYSWARNGKFLFTIVF